MMNYILIFFGGGIGSLLRFILSTHVNNVFSAFFPFGTLVVNLLGSFVIGICFEFFERFFIAEEFRILITVGFLGGFTTFSSFALENINLLRMGEYRYFLINLLTQNIAGLLFVFSGIVLARIFLKFYMK